MQVTSLLTDLKLLASSSAEDEEERAYFATLLNYYTRVSNANASKVKSAQVDRALPLLQEELNKILQLY